MSEEKVIDPILSRDIERLNDSDPYTRWNHIETDLVERDHVRMKVVLRPEHRNLMGIPHGGLYYTLADDAAGATAMTDGCTYVTQNSDFRFIRYTTHGTLYSDAYVVSRGKHICIIRVTVTDDEGKLLCEGSSSFFKTRDTY